MLHRGSKIRLISRYYAICFEFATTLKVLQHEQFDFIKCKRWWKHWCWGNGDCTKAHDNNGWTQNKQKITKMQSKLP